MRKSLVLLALLAPLAVPATAAAQGFGVGVKVGSVGIGVDGAVSLGSMVNIRAGGSLFPVDVDAEIGDIDWNLDLPDTYLNLGIDLYPTGGGFRIIGGLLFKPDDAEIEATFTQPQDIGGRTYTPQQIGTLIGTVKNSTVAPFVGVGFGRHTSSGVGITADFGLAFLGEPDLELTAQGGSLSAEEQAEFNNRLETEENQTEADLREDKFPQRLLKMYPLLQVGVRFGIGR